MVTIWLMMVNNNLVGGAITILKHMKVNGKDDIPYMKWNMKNVWSHQPERVLWCLTKKTPINLPQHRDALPRQPPVSPVATTKNRHRSRLSAVVLQFVHDDILSKSAQSSPWWNLRRHILQQSLSGGIKHGSLVMSPCFTSPNHERFH